MSDDLTPSETLRLFADLMDAAEGRAIVKIFPSTLRDLADEIDNDMGDEIALVTESGEEYAKFTGEEATKIIKAAVQKFISELVFNSLSEHNRDQ
jgi:hypothetical protein